MGEAPAGGQEIYKILTAISIYFDKLSVYNGSISRQKEMVHPMKGTVIPSQYLQIALDLAQRIAKGELPPESVNDIRTNMIIIAALVEGVALFAVVVCFLAL